MAKRERAARKPSTRRRRATARKRTPAAIGLKNEVVSLRRELIKARQQQAAAADVLKAMSQSTFDLQPVFDTIAENAVRLCEAERAYIFRFDGKVLRAVASYNVGRENKEWVYRNPIAPGRHSVSARSALERRTVQVPDVQADPEYAYALRDVDPIRTSLAVPMLKGDDLVGTITIYRLEVKPFTDKQIALVETFADQAVIAIENVRLFDEVQARTNDLSESLQQQTATADVLKVISRSAFDIQAVLETLVESASRLCQAENVQIFLRDGEVYRLAAHNGFSPEYQAYVEQHPISVGRGTLVARTALEVAPVHIPDALADPEYTWLEGQKLAGFRALLGVPLLREGSCVGVMAMSRMTPRPFTARQTELVTTFADQAVIAIENVRLFDEVQQRTEDLRESLQQQTATADVLKVISRSAFDLEAVLNTLVRSAVTLSGARTGTIFQKRGELYHLTAEYGYTPAMMAYGRANPIAPGIGSNVGRTAMTGSIVQIPDVLADPDFTSHGYQRIGNFRAMLGIPIKRDGKVEGVFSLAKPDPGPFEPRHVELVQTFADQAAIAIENVRLFDEVQARTEDLRESLQQQTATADVLKVISRSTFDLKPVLDSLVETATTLCGADKGFLYLMADGRYRLHAAFGFEDDFRAFCEQNPVDPENKGTLTGRVASERRIVHIEDAATDSRYTWTEARERWKIGTLLGVPLLRDGEVIGTFSLARTHAQPFTEKQIELVQTFADQAVIAIGNVRLFEEVQARTEDLRESLQQQTATADVLKVISRSTFDLQTVLDTLLESATGLCDAEHAWLFRREDELLHWVASYGHAADVHARIRDHFMSFQVPLNRGSVTGRTVLEARVIHVPDVLADPEYTLSEVQNIGGYRAALGVPLLRRGNVVGVIFVAKTVPQPFTSKQIELVATFADQALIAIENTRLLNEQRESLQQQTATADVLKVISRSTFDLPAVLQTLVESAARLCDADKTNITREKNGAFYRAEAYGFSPDFQDYVKDIPIEAERGSASGRALLEGRVVHIPDVKADPEYTLTEGQRLGGYRTVLAIPMLREGVPIGVMNLTRSEVRPFTDKQIELATTFADQAVIAIKNVLLFDEVQARTRDLSQSVEELRALGEVSQAVNSTVDLETVLNTIVAKAAQLSGTEAGTIYVFDDTAQEFHLRASYGMDEAIIAAIKDRHIHIGETAIGQAVEQRIPIQIPDIQDDPNSPVLDIIVRAGFRALLIVPLVSTDRTVGALVVRRKRPGEFPKHTVDLLQTFAAQSVLAIQNARLFENVEARTRELAKSLEELRTAQDRLVQTQKLASLGQLTAGIAHEIKNPLNFINNFSALSVELIDELDDVLKPATLDNKTREDAHGLTEMLKGNLEKVVQHGKRVDSIVKSMLLHSREGSGERRPVDLNSLVAESLNLAYHGARAEQQEFKIRLNQSFDPAAGEIELLPQEIIRVLLNLISNGFYAAMKRKTEESNGHEPALTATTKNLGDRVEIGIRDNGGGIPPEVKEKMFNPFFTTKPPGEGTGLGLSLSHDIVVKQHGGSIEVDTQPGEFTEFKVILPRMAATGKAGADK